MTVADNERERADNGRFTRRQMLYRVGVGGAALTIAPSVLAACGGDNSSSGGSATTAASGGSATTAAGAATTAAGAATTAAAAPSGGSGDVGADLAKLLKIDPATSGKGQTLDMGAVLALTGTGSFYGKTMSRGLDLAAKHIEAAGGPKYNYIYIDHKSGDPAAGKAAITELGSKNVPAKFASYTDDIGVMLDGTAQYKMFTLDGGGGTSVFGQGKPYFWGTRAITPNDPLPGLFKWTKETYPDAKTVGVIIWDLGAANNDATTKDVLAKIAASGYQHNGLYELTTIGNQDFSQVIPKIKAKEPDILLVSIWGQDPGSFANQAETAGLKAVRIGVEFTPDGLNASKGTYDKDGYTFAYDYFDSKNPTSPLAKLFVDDFKKEYGEEPDFYAANFYENGLVMWEVIRRVLKEGGNIKDGAALDKALQENLTVVSVYGGDAQTVGTFTLDPVSHSVKKRTMGVFEYKGGDVTAKAFFGIGGEDYKKM
jgi:ABC-type branched-subunit amino acid transport system substrate-binding protein